MNGDPGPPQMRGDGVAAVDGVEVDDDDDTCVEN
jgi:hypothetical protein